MGQITQYPAVTAVSLDDLLLVVDDPGGTPASKKATVQQLLAAVYPVGAIYCSVVSTSPATLFGGTWVAIAAGRVLVGIDAGQTEFDTVEETGGAKTHTLTVAEMPAHTHLTQRYPTATGSNSGFTIDTSMSGTPTNNTLPTASTGGGGAHNNLQPYLVVHMWKRTA